MRRHSRSESVGKPDPDVENVDIPTALSRKRSKSKDNIIKRYMIDYTSNSNLHGLKYIGEKERTFVEKVFWLFMFVCSVVLCSGLIRKLWIKWNESPVIVSFAETTTPVWQIPYPAVTICFETKAMQGKFNFTYYYHEYLNSYDNLTEEERNLFEDVSLVCDDHLAPERGRKFASGAETVKNLREVSPNMTDVFFGCKYKDNPKQTCADLFNPILTEEGQCYTFNSLGAQDLFRLENLHSDYEYLENYMNNTGWSLDDGYVDKSASNDTYPHKGLGYGVKAGITFLMTANETDFDYICKGPVQGFKILLHNPAELPRLSQQYFRSPLSQEVVVAVKPKMMTTSSGLIPYDPEVRQCYFQNERYLQYFKIYTQANCEMECLTNFTYARCGCVHFGVPHGPNMERCNAGSVACLKRAQLELVTAESHIDQAAQAGEEESLIKARKAARNCKCLPACTSIEYESETSQADYNWKKIFEAYKLPIPENEKELKYSRTMIFFKEAQFITSRRSELYGQTDFLANCGGLLGLFLGFSILSVVEIIYFLSLRICCLLWRRREAKKKDKVNPADEKDISSPKMKQAYVD